jgi:hypothetical protein
MQRYTFRLDVSTEQYLDYYRGGVRHVLARSASGQNVQFPASLLQRFVTPEGVHGDFVLTCDDNHKGASLERLSTPEHTQFGGEPPASEFWA